MVDPYNSDSYLASSIDSNRHHIIDAEDYISITDDECNEQEENSIKCDETLIKKTPSNLTVVEKEGQTSKRKVITSSSTDISQNKDAALNQNQTLASKKEAKTVQGADKSSCDGMMKSNLETFNNKTDKMKSTPTDVSISLYLGQSNAKYTTCQDNEELTRVQFNGRLNTATTTADKHNYPLNENLETTPPQPSSKIDLNLIDHCQFQHKQITFTYIQSEIQHTVTSDINISRSFEKANLFGINDNENVIIYLGKIFAMMAVMLLLLWLAFCLVDYFFISSGYIHA